MNLIRTRFPSSERIIVASTGAWQPSKSFDPLGQALQPYNYRLFCPNKPVDDLKSGHHEYAEYLAAFILNNGFDPENTTLMVHSRGGNDGPLVAQLICIRHILYENAVVPPTEEDLEREKQLNLPPRFGADFWGGVTRDEETGLECYSPETALKVFLNKCKDKALARRTVDSFVPNRPKPEETVLKERPNVPESVIIGKYDMALRRAWQLAAARSRLGEAAIIKLIRADHLPHISNPLLTARVINKIDRRVG